MAFCTRPKDSVSRFPNLAPSSATARRRASARTRCSAAITSASRTRSRAGSPSRCSTPCSRGPASSPILLPDHAAQTRPSLVDRTDFVVDEPGRQRDLANGVLDDIRRYARRFLRPCDPESAGLRHLLPARGDLLCQIDTLLDEDDKYICAG